MAEGILAGRTTDKFRELFGSEYILAKSPGRVNIIGEHTDYNEGFVLPAAIDKAVYVAVNRSGDDTIRMHAVEFNESRAAQINDLKPVPGSWTNYILGVVDQLQKRGIAIEGFNLVIDGDVPTGAGLSSSAAVECATVFALNTLFELNIPREEMIFIAQKTEHEFAGVMCGIMDQFASMYGKEGHVIKLDCRSLDYEYVPLELQEYSILLLNTNVKHSLASSEYNLRRQQCEQGVELVRKTYPEVKSLRDTTLTMLDECIAGVDPLVYQRCLYVVEENIRLLQACDDLKQGNLKALGEKMYASHYGLSKQYEVSCRELDFLVDNVKDHPAVAGARMMGGGFGGCTINLVLTEAIEDLVKELSAAYKQAMQLELTPYVVTTGDGSTIVERS